MYFSMSPRERSHLSNHVVRPGSNWLDTSDSNSPPPVSQLEMVRNGPQSLDANDVMVNAWGLPGGVLKIPIDRRITSNEGSCVKVVSCFFLR